MNSVPMNPANTRIRNAVSRSISSGPFQRRRTVSERSHSGIDVFLSVCLQAEDNVANTFGCGEDSRALQQSFIDRHAIMRQYCVREVQSAPVKHPREVNCGIADGYLTPVDDSRYVPCVRAHEDMLRCKIAVHQSRGDAIHFAGINGSLEECTEPPFECIQSDVFYNLDVTRRFSAYLVDQGFGSISRHAALNCIVDRERV